MNEMMEPRKTKERSPNFPFIALELALERARQLHRDAKRASFPFQSAAKLWSYSPSSSGALQTVAALKQYGLLTDEGSGAQRKIKLTDLALRILLDLRPDSPEREGLKRQAALMPPIAAEVHEKWPERLPEDHTVHHFLVFDLDFSHEAALKVTKILQQNSAFTGMLVSDTVSDELENPGDSMREAVPGMDVRRESPPAPLVQESPKTAISRGKEIGAAIPVTGNCSMTILADGAVTQEGLNRLIAYIQLIQGSFPATDSPPVSPPTMATAANRVSPDHATQTSEAEPAGSQ